MYEIAIKDLETGDDMQLTTEGFIMSCINKEGLSAGIKLIQIGTEEAPMAMFSINFYARYTETLRDLFKDVPVLYELFNRTSLQLDNIKDSALQPSSHERIN